MTVAASSQVDDGSGNVFALSVLIDGESLGVAVMDQWLEDLSVNVAVWPGLTGVSVSSSGLSEPIIRRAVLTPGNSVVVRSALPKAAPRAVTETAIYIATTVGLSPQVASGCQNDRKAAEAIARQLSNQTVPASAVIEIAIGCAPIIRFSAPVTPTVVQPVDRAPSRAVESERGRCAGIVGKSIASIVSASRNRSFVNEIHQLLGLHPPADDTVQQEVIADIIKQLILKS
jgi:hypothetical protein